MPTFATFKRLKDKGVAAGALAVLSASALLALACQRAGVPNIERAGLVRDPVRVVTWNIRKCELGFERVVSELTRLDADVICLQEVIEPRAGSSVQNQTQDLAKALGMYACSSGGPLDEQRQQCLAILCRAPLFDTTALSVAPERNYGVTAIARWHGQPLRIVCVHLAGTYKANLQHIVETSQDRARDWEALQDEATGWAEPMILAGDFNTPGASQEFRRLGERLYLVPDTGHTFPSRAPLLDLDHLLHSRELRVSVAENVESQASDHRPLLAAFTLRTD